MQIQLPEHVKYILKTFRDAGYEAYAVGGCVRDSILGKEPKDWDITTNATPTETKALFARTIDTGIVHGTVTILLDHTGYEVTTYRVDGEYEDGRHPKQVSFTASLAEDLRRRDFTINAMAYSDEEGLVDLFGGINDLEQGIIRCVGMATERFTEDALRMMRAIRFSAQLGFELEAETMQAIRILAPTIRKISAERIQMELIKTLLSDHPQHMRLLYELGLSAYFLPEFDRMMETGQVNPHHCYSVGEHTIHALSQVLPDKVLRLTMLLHDVAKPACKTSDEAGIDHFHGHPKLGAEMAKQILRRLKLDNDTIRRVSSLILWHDDNPPLTARAVRRAVVRVGIEQFPDLFAVKRADVLAQSDYKRDEKLLYIDDYERIYQEIRRQQQCLCIRDLAVDGKDLMEAGITQGKEIGETLKRLLELVLEEPEKNTKEYLLSQIKES